MMTLLSFGGTKAATRERTPPGLPLADQTGTPSKTICEIKMITAISGNSITIDTPLMWTQWAATWSPTVSNFGGTSGYQMSGSGLESFYIDSSATTAPYSIFVQQCYGCWFENVCSYMAYGYHIAILNAERCEFRRFRWWQSQIHAENCGGLVMVFGAATA